MDKNESYRQKILYYRFFSRSINRRFREKTNTNIFIYNIHLPAFSFERLKRI